MKASELFLMGYEHLIALEGKAPRFKGWPQFRAEIEDVLMWEEQGQPNLGLLTERFPAIDVDVTDKEAAVLIMQVLCEVFGMGVPLRVGRKPKFLALFRLADTDAPNRKTKLTLVAPDGSVHQIEILGKGQQFVIDGIHPDTGQAYNWVRPLVPAAELPILTEEKFSEFVAVLEAALGGIGWRIDDTVTTGARTTVNAEQLLAPSLELLSEAVKNIPNSPDRSVVPRETFVSVGHAIKAAVKRHEDDDGFRIFDEWARRGPYDAEATQLFWETIERDNVSIGWDNIRERAEKNGWNAKPAALAEAQQDFEPVPEAAAQVSDFPLTLSDVENEVRVASYLRQQELGLFCTLANDWYIWDGTYWKPDPTNGEHAKGVIADLLFEIACEIEEKYGDGKKVKPIVNKLCSYTYANSIFKKLHASGWLYIDRDRVNSTDTYERYLNTPGGFYELSSCTYYPLGKKQYVTQTTSVTPDFKADCPEFKKFLLSSCGGDEQLFEYVLAILGSALTTDVRTRLIWFLTGESGAGKSTLLKHVHAILGSYAAVVPPGALVHGEQQAHQSAVAGFRDRRFLHGSEIDRGNRWNVALLKSITGNEVITARRLYKEYEEFTLVGKIIIAGNETPSLPNVDSAVKQRLRVIQFHAPEEPDMDLDEKLRAEYPAILALLMVHAKQWIEEGYPYCEAVRQLTDAYFSDEDEVGQFRDQYFLTTGNNDHFVPYHVLQDLWLMHTTPGQRKELGIPTYKSLSKVLRNDKRIITSRRFIDGKQQRGLAGLVLRDESSIDALQELL